MADPVHPTDVAYALSGGPTDEAAIPTLVEERVLFVPRPSWPNGPPVCTADELRPAHRRALKEAHRLKVRQWMEDRKILLDRCLADPEFREKVIERCRRDPVFFINLFGWTYDDRDDIPTKPLILYDRQEEEVRNWKKNYVDVPEGRVTQFDEKSRAWGWTWIMAVWCRLWLFLLRDGWTVLYGHDKLEKLDDGGQAATHECTFGKIRWALRSLPEWFIPPGLWDPTNNKIGLIRHPTTTNLLKADFYCSNFGRGDRYSDIVCDEAAASDNFGTAETSMKQTSRRIHIGTTPRGRDNDAGRLRWGPKKKNIRTLHWTDNPTLDIDWYWLQREHYTVEEAAQEIDISWDRSATGRIFKNFSRDRNVRDFDYDPSLPLYVCADPGFDDPTALVWIQPSIGVKEWRIVDFLQMAGRPGEYYVPFITGTIPPLTIDSKPWPHRYSHQQMEMITRHASWKPPTGALGGSDGAASSIITGSFSLFDLWHAYGAPYFYPVSFAGRGGSKEEAIRMVEIALPRIAIAKRLLEQRAGGAGTPTIVECFEQYSWVDRTDNPSGRKMKRDPKHDVYCHAMDAVQMYMWYEDVIDPDVQPVHRQEAPTPPGGTLPEESRRVNVGGSVIVVGQDSDPIARK